jgi:hypothetical protein
MLDIEQQRPLARQQSAMPARSSRTWRSCCLETDRQATVYIGQLVFAFSVLGFSAIMLVKSNGDCEQSSPYIGLISFLLGKLLSSVTDSTH